MPGKLREVLHSARLKLDGGEADAFDPARHAESRRLVGVNISVAPDHVRGETLRCGVAGQIVGQYPDRCEAVGKLEADDLIAHLPGANLVQIVLGRADLGGGAAIAGQAAAERDSLQLEPLGNRPARIVQALADTQATAGRIDRQLEAVEPVPGRIVAAAETVAGDRFPVMRAERDCFIDAGCGAIADDFALVERDELTVGKVVDLPLNHAGTIGTEAGIDAADERDDCGNVALFGGPDLETRGSFSGQG